MLKINRNRGFPLKVSSKTGFLLFGRLVLYSPEVIKVWFLTAFSAFIKAWKKVLQGGKRISVLESRMFTDHRENTCEESLVDSKLIFKVL